MNTKHVSSQSLSGVTLNICRCPFCSPHLSAFQTVAQPSVGSSSPSNFLSPSSSCCSLTTPGGSPRLSPSRMPQVPSPLLASSPCLYATREVSPSVYSSRSSSPGTSATASPTCSSPTRSVSTNSLYKPSIPSPLVVLPAGTTCSPAACLSPTSHLAPQQGLRRSLSFTFGAKAKGKPKKPSSVTLAPCASRIRRSKSLKHTLDSSPVHTNPLFNNDDRETLHRVKSTSLLNTIQHDPIVYPGSITNKSVFAYPNSTPRSTTSLTTPDSSHTDSDISPTTNRRHTDSDVSNALVRRAPETEVSPIPTQKPSDSSPVTVRRRSKSGPKDSLPRFSISVEDESVMFQQKGKHAALYNLGDGCFLSRWPCGII